ncbi:MAG TPA: leucine-rich repeat protein, partial [Methanomassiliicoccales archaeon]|nr:leucine-rich repeat protein [Methanomassiliicoccales archaeon]
MADSVVHLGDWAFEYCSSLQSVTLSGGLSLIGCETFRGCTALTSVIFHNGITSVGPNTFNGCTALTSISFPDSITTVGSTTFYECTGLKSVTFPDGITSIGYETFYGCSNLATITIPGSVASIGQYTFSSCTGLTSVTIDNGVPAVGDWDFNGCDHLVSVAIPNSVTYVGNGSFASCPSLATITFPESLTMIGDYVFDYSGLTSIVIPRNVTSIGVSSFYGSSSLVSAVFDGSSTNIEPGAFSYDNSLVSVSLPIDLQYIREQTFVGCSALESILIPNGLLGIGQYAFGYCTALTSVIIPDSVVNIDGHAFTDCSSLRTAVLPDSNCWLDGSIFYNCVNLQSVIIPHAARICPYTFAYCASLTSIILPDGLASIDSNAFAGCSALTSIVIPDDVSSIADQAFTYCSGLVTATIGRGVSQIGPYAFAYCSSLVSIDFHEFRAPIGLDSSWITGTPSSIRGHARSTSDFPSPGTSYFGLTMGGTKHFDLIPDTPNGLSVDKADYYHVVLTWDAPLDDGDSPITVYSIYGGNAAGSESLVAQTSDTIVTLDATYGITHFYFVTATNVVGEGKPSSEISAVQRVPWTVLVYMDADNDLEQNAIDNFLQMASVGSGPNVQIVVLFDRIPGYSADFGDWTDTRLFHVEKGMTPTAENGTSLGELDMGNPQTLTNFLSTNELEYPADNYTLILWDHGLGARGICADETSSISNQTSYLWLSDVDQAIRMAVMNSTFCHVSLLGMDACSMATVEVAYELASDCEAIVASQETVPASGWPYASILADMDQHPGLDPVALGADIVRLYNESYEGNPLATMSCISMEGVPNLADCARLFALQLMSGDFGATDLDTYYSEIYEARLNAEHFYKTYETDFADFLERLIPTLPSCDLRTRSQDLLDAINQTIVVEWHGSSHANANGLSLYFPGTYSEYESSFEASHSYFLGFNSYTGWLDFLDSFLLSSAVKPDAPDNLVVVPGDGTAQLIWNAPTSYGGSIDHYNIYRGTLPGEEALLTDSSGTSFTDDTLENGITYYYQVSAVTIADLEGSCTSEARVVPNAAYEFPLQLEVSGIGDGKIELAWNLSMPMPSGSSYSIIETWSSLDGGDRVKIIDNVSSPCVVDGLTNGDLYSFVVCLSSPEDGFITQSNVVRGYLPGISNLFVDPWSSNFIAGGQVILSWSNPDSVIDTSSTGRPFGAINVSLVFADCYI